MDLNKLLDKEKLCIVETPSACIAECPLHVDVKELVTHVINEDFEKAYISLSKKIPFLELVCLICDHPCEKKCVRKNNGGSIAISDLEKAVLNYAVKKNKKKIPSFKNGKKIAVVGGGVSGLTLAIELRKKGYSITIFEAKGEVGGRFLNYKNRELPEFLLKKELNSIKNSGLDIKTNTKVIVNSESQIEAEDSAVLLQTLVDSYDAVYIGTGTFEEELEINTITFETKINGVFAAGDLIKENNSSLIQAVSSGKRAAISIDRYIKGSSLTAVRENEGSYETSLKVNLDEVAGLKRVEKGNNEIYTKEEAIEEAKRCLKCQCQSCSIACTHLRKYNINPKRYIRSINHNERVILGDHYANKMINSCTRCGLCGEVCPSGINMADIIKETRESMVLRGKMPPSAHAFALKDMEFNNSDKFKLVKHEPGFKESKYLFFPGCQLSASSPEYVNKTYDYLRENIKEGVGLYLGCCGAPAEWASRMDIFKESIEKIKENWISMGSPIMILACSTCNKMFKEYMPEITVKSLWEIMLQFGLSREVKADKSRIFNIHDACTTRNEKQIHENVRAIVKNLGYEIEELKYTKEKTQCCGYGGLVFYANKEMAEDFVKDRIEEGKQDYLAYCSMCRDLFAWKGKRTLHLLDLIFGEDLDSLASRKGPTLSERHKNRTKLKINMLKKYWGEDMKQSDANLNLKLSQQVIDKIEDRLILIEDIEQVLLEAEETGKRFINKDTKHFLARKKIADVTYWVEYDVKDSEYVVYSAYSHRMEIIE